MFGIGFLELVFIAVAVLLVVGPKKLPDVMKQAGRFFVQIRRTANDVRSTFDTVIREAEDEIRKEEIAALRALTSKPTTAPTAGAAAAALTEGTQIVQPVPYDPHFNTHPDPHHDPGHNPDGTLATQDSGHKSEPTNG